MTIDASVFSSANPAIQIRRSIHAERQIFGSVGNECCRPGGDGRVYLKEGLVVSAVNRHSTFKITGLRGFTCRSGDCRVSRHFGSTCRALLNAAMF